MLQDRAVMLRLASETPVLEDTVIRILMMGMETEYPLKASDALDVMELMVNRAAALNTTSMFVLLRVCNSDLSVAEWFPVGLDKCYCTNRRT